MVWRSNGPAGSEAQKVGFDIVHYLHGRVLDLGCGGRKVFPGKHIIGIDNNVDAKLFGMPANPDINADCDKLGMFADGSIDVIFSSHLIEHFEDTEAALKEWWRVLRPGGRLILYWPHPHWYPCIGMPGSNPDHKHDIMPDEMTQLMRSVAWRTGRGWEQERNETRTGGNEYSQLQVYKKKDGVGCTEFQPKHPRKTIGLVRLGAFGDALWISTILPKMKEKYPEHDIVLYTQRQGEASLRHDPHIAEFRVQADGVFGVGSEAAAIQGNYWLWAERQHDVMINLVGCVERTLLPHPVDPNFYLPDQQRRWLMDVNYYESVHEWAGVPFDPKTIRVRFYPHPDEVAWAAAERAKFDGPFVVINPTGSSLPKYWPHTQRCMEILAEQGVGGVVLGDLRHTKLVAPKGWRIVGMDWDIRKAYTIAQLADVVIATESAIVNSVAHEAPFKIVLLSHSTATNLTRDWDRTLALEPTGLACYPCHRIHQDMTFCTVHNETGAAACQAAATAEEVAGYALQWINGELKEAA